MLKKNNKDMETILTKEGYEKLKQDLIFLKNEKMKEVAERIKIAISFGDLSENSEYEDAKNEQAHLEGKISELENKLSNVKIIDEDDLGNNQKVVLGSRVRIENIITKDKFIVSIVGSMEFNPYDLKISNESPIGKKLLNKKPGSIVKVKLPNGDIVQYKILEII